MGSQRLTDGATEGTYNFVGKILRVTSSGMPCQFLPTLVRKNIDKYNVTMSCIRATIVVVEKQ